MRLLISNYFPKCEFVQRVKKYTIQNWRIKYYKKLFQKVSYSFSNNFILLSSSKFKLWAWYSSRFIYITLVPFLIRNYDLLSNNYHKYFCILLDLMQVLGFNGESGFLLYSITYWNLDYLDRAPKSLQDR